MNVLGVIPARLESTRLPRKLLRDLCGKPLVQHVYENVKESKLLNDVVVACDDQLLVDAVKGFGGKAVLTSTAHQSGTQRIQEVAQKMPADIYVNIQGDEPLMPADNVDSLIRAFAERKEYLVGTLALARSGREEYLNKNVVKVAVSQTGQALYFSRSPIPCYRDGGEINFWKHLGIYAYRSEFWKLYGAMKPSALEQAEKLEQLKFLENGVSMLVIEARHDSIGVDTQEDLDVVANLFANKKTATKVATTN